MKYLFCFYIALSLVMGHVDTASADDALPRFSLGAAKQLLAQFGKQIEDKVREQGLRAEDLKSIKYLGKGIYEIPENLRQRGLFSLPQLVRSVKIRDLNIDGLENTFGFEVQELDTNSVFRSLGVEKGDIVQTVNDTELLSKSVVAEVFYQEKFARDVLVGLLRDSEVVELRYLFK